MNRFSPAPSSPGISAVSFSSGPTSTIGSPKVRDFITTFPLSLPTCFLPRAVALAARRPRVRAHDPVRLKSESMRRWRMAHHEDKKSGMQTGLQPRPRYSRPLLPPSLVLGQGDAGPPPERIGFRVSPCPSILPHPHPVPAMVDPDKLRRRLTMIGVSEPPAGAALDHLAARLMEASPGLLPVRCSAIARAAATTSCARRAATRSTRTARSTCFPFLLAKDPRSQHQQHPEAPSLPHLYG